MKTKKLSVFTGAVIFLIAFSTLDSFAQSPAKYICDNFNGELTEAIEGRSFMGETYRCDVKEQWDMMIQSKVNDMILNDKYFGNAKEWKQTYVDSENYNRRSFSFETDEYSIVNLYIPYEQKINHFYIAQ